MDDSEGRKAFFSEEKKQKTLQMQVFVPPAQQAAASGKGRDSTRKSLLVLFFRKEHLPVPRRRGVPELFHTP